MSALFAGGSGTGKSLAATALSGQLDLALYRVDLGRVAGKHIGETEKNLQRVFADARRSRAVLYFDESDALSGKRTEVKDSHDRFANLEVSYLLQRAESYPGLVILATNRRSGMDKALLRRFDCIIEFPGRDPGC